MKSMRTKSGLRGPAAGVALGMALLGGGVLQAAAQEMTTVEGIDAPIYVGNLEAVRDAYGRPMPGTHLKSLRSLVELRVTTNGVVRPPSTNGVAHPYHPLVSTNSTGGMGLNAAGTDSGLFCMVLQKRPGTNIQVFARVYNAANPGDATFYADSYPAPMPGMAENSLVLTFREAQPVNPGDDDGDGLNNSWEELLGIHDRPTADYDGDGMSDYHEMLAGTAPDDPGSRLSFRLVRRETVPAPAGADEEAARPVRVRWQSVPGKQYQLEYVMQLGTDPVTGEVHEIIPVGEIVTAGAGEFEIDMVVDLPEDALTGVFRVKLVVQE